MGNQPTPLATVTASEASREPILMLAPIRKVSCKAAPFTSTLNRSLNNSTNNNKLTEVCFYSLLAGKAKNGPWQLSTAAMRITAWIRLNKQLSNSLRWTTPTDNGRNKLTCIANPLKQTAQGRLMCQHRWSITTFYRALTSSTCLLATSLYPLVNTFNNEPIKLRRIGKKAVTTWMAPGPPTPVS